LPGPKARRGRHDELDDLAQAAAGLAGRPTGGPLGLHTAGPPAAARAAAPLEGVADRMLVGKTRDGLPEVRLQLSAAGWHGTEVRLVAGKHGLEATLVVASEAARRVVESQLADLARALEARGLHVARCQIAARADADADARERRRGRDAACARDPG